MNRTQVGDNVEQAPLRERMKNRKRDAGKAFFFSFLLKLSCMASEEEIQEESQSGPCLVCCSVRSASVGVATGAVLGLFVGGAADIALARKGAVRSRLN